MAVMTDVHHSRPSRWLMPLLVGSLALNLLVIGAAGSLLWRKHIEGSETASLRRRGAPNVLTYAVSLPPERVKELEQLTKEEWEKVRPLRSAQLAARDEVAKALTAEPFDQERFIAAQAQLATADRALREAAFDLHTAIATHLTPAERAGFVKWRERHHLHKTPLDTPEGSASGQQR
jgi:uncharacterized membrane protein